MPGPHATPTVATRAMRWVRGLWAELSGYGVLDWAAALTYYAVLSIGPALVVTVALLGLLGVTAALLDQLAEFAPGAARDVVAGIISDIEGAGSGSGVVLLATGLATAVWSASGYVGAYGRASFAIRGGGTRNSGLAQTVARVVTTLTIFVLLFLITAMVLFSGPLAERGAKLVGLDESFPGIWSLLKWPMILGAMVMVVSLLNSAAGDLRRVRTRLLSYGALLSIALWIPLSLGFSFYVSRFGSFSRVYGSLAGVVIFLVWLWMSNVALLLGVLLDSRRARRRATVVV